MQISFTPKEMTLLASVLDAACQKLGRVDEKTKEMLALKILNRASDGDLDFASLLACVSTGETADAA